MYCCGWNWFAAGLSQACMAQAGSLAVSLAKLPARPLAAAQIHPQGHYDELLLLGENKL